MFTNRFYYSEQQKAAQLACGHDGHCFVVLSTGKEVEYTEWCSSPNSKCNWDDARLVYASDVVPQIHHIMGPEEKEDWDRLMQESLDYDTEIWEDLGELDEPNDDSAAFEAYEQEAQEAWDKYMDNRPWPDIDDLTPDMDEDIPEEHLRELRKIEEPYLRGKHFNQDT